jgi:transposase InsO family protein
LVGQQAIRPDPPISSGVSSRDAAEKAWVMDMTYIRTSQGWLYPAVVMDLFSRKIVGWSAGPTIHRELMLRLHREK